MVDLIIYPLIYQNNLINNHYKKPMKKDINLHKAKKPKKPKNGKEQKMKNKLINKKNRKQKHQEEEIQQEEEMHVQENQESQQLNWKQKQSEENCQSGVREGDGDDGNWENGENGDGEENLGELEEGEEKNGQQEEVSDQNEGEVDLLAQNQRNLQEYQQQIGKTGVIYMSRVPPYMTPNFIRKLLNSYDIKRIYLLPQSEWARKNRIKNGGSKRICFRQGWIQFADKRVAKMAALTLNGQKMVHKKGSFYSEDLWNIKYLPKFKWHNLTEKLAHEQRIKKEKLRLQMQQQRKVQQYYTTQIHKSKAIKGIIKQKLAKGKDLKEGNRRSYGQMSTISEQKD